MVAEKPLAGRYALGQAIGTGGMGIVYRAHDLETDRVVAVKLLHPTDTTGQERFEREAAALASLTHETIVRYERHGRTDEGQLYLVTEWIDGQSLAEAIEGKRLGVASVVAIGRRIARALAEAHARGIVHRDVKPSNVLLPEGRAEQAKLIDFGIARGGALSRTTKTGIVLGTPGYMAPEQVRGDAFVDGRSDLFSLGCVLHEAIAGAPPFDGEHIMAILAKILLEPPVSLRALRGGVPAALDELVARLLAKSAEQRPASAEVVAEALEAISVDAADDVPRSAPEPASLAGEQRLVSVIVITDADRDRATLQRIDEAARASAAARAPGADFTATGGPETSTLEIDAELHVLVASFEGTLEILADGTQIIVFSGSRSATDQAALAVRCALAVRRTAPAHAHVTLATGRGRRSARWPVGEAIDRAVRLARSGALEGSVWIDDVTAGLVDGRFEIEGERGARRVVREAHDAERVRPLLGKVTPFVGRARDLRMLEGVVLSAFEDAEAAAVLVRGDGGVGKSRLRVELLRAIGASCEVWFARGDALRTRSPFGVAAQLVRAAAQISADEAAAIARRKLRVAVEGVVVREEAARVAVFLGELAGLPFPQEEIGAAAEALRAARRDPQLLGDQVQRAFEDFVVGRCARGPVLVVVEDLQWADAPSVRFLGAALRLARRSPLCVIGLGRPEMDEVFPQLWADQRLVEVRLRELGAKAAEELVRAVLGADAATATVEAIVRRAAGNALCLEELLRAAAIGETASVPESVVAIAQGRLGGLEGPLRRVLRAASVLGGVFWRGAVAELLGGAQRELDLGGALRKLVEREIVERESQSRFAGEEQLSFRHPVLQEAAYATLTEEDRPRAHALAGQWLARHGETDALVIANHLALGGAHAEEPPWLLRAAEQALEGGDPTQAVSLCERGLAARRASGTAGEEEGSLLLLLAEAQRWRGAFAICEKAAVAALEKLARGSREWLRASEEALIAAGRRGDDAAVRALAEAAFEATVAEDAASAKVTCLCAAGRHFLHGGDVEAADVWLERAASLCATLGPHEPRAVAELHRLRGARARQMGDPLGDRYAYGIALEELQRAGDLRAACNARTSLGFACLQLGEIDTAEVELQRALEDATRLGIDAVRVRAQQNLGLVLATRGDLAGALALLSQVAEVCRAQGNARFEAWTRVYIARIAERAGDDERAVREAAAAAEALASAPSALAGALAVWGRALARQGDLSEARQKAGEALGILERLGTIEEFEPLVRAAYAEIFGLEDAGVRGVVRTGVERIAVHADRIADPARREAYLRGVVEHGALLDLAERAGALDEVQVAERSVGAL